MGCFSYLCGECEQPINSDSSSGEHCIMFLLKDGKLLEWMQGEYDSYGRVFHDGGQSSQEWTVLEWGDIVDLQYGDDADSGLAVYHSGCYTKDTELVPSDGDPEQGWGKYRYPTAGKFDHGTKIKAEPVWTKAQ